VRVYLVTNFINPKKENSNAKVIYRVAFFIAKRYIKVIYLLQALHEVHHVRHQLT
jgi:hypothetical protein